MIDKLSEASVILGRHFGLLAALVLTVWLPGNLLMNYALYMGSEEDFVMTVLRANGWIEAIFGPVYSGAIIHALVCHKMSQPVDYRQAMREGLRNWSSLFAARLVTGIYIVLGLIALVIPGIYLALRYSLIDSVVVIEGVGVSQACKRSTELTKGIRWQILGVWVVSIMAIMSCSFMIYLPLSIVQEVANLPLAGIVATETAVDCFLDVLFTIPSIACFLYYWEGREEEESFDEQEAASAE